MKTNNKNGSNLNEFEMAVLEAICFSTKSDTVAEGLQKLSKDGLWEDLMSIINDPRVIEFSAEDVTKTEVEEFANQHLNFRPNPR